MSPENSRRSAKNTFELQYHIDGPSGSALSSVKGIEVTPGDVRLEKGSSLVVLARFHGTVPTEATLVSVENGQEAVDAYADGGFDLILMDMQMPVMDGLTATAAIRALEAERGVARTPLLMLTANAMPEHVEAGRLAGADGHLAKPVTTASLFAAIASALNAVDPEVGAEEIQAA